MNYMLCDSRKFKTNSAFLLQHLNIVYAVGRTNDDDNGK